jgi:TatD DNase family protein
MAIGAYFSFSGMITFKNWTPVVPLSDYPSTRLLVETDSPYLAPVPHRGTRNEPAYVCDVATRAAALRGESLDTLAQTTSENARRCFGARLEMVL